MISERYRYDGIATWDMDILQQEYKNVLLNKIKNGSYKLDAVERCFCGSNAYEILSEKDRFGLNFGTRLCTDCGLVYTSPRLGNENLEDFYSRIYWGLTTGNRSYQNSESVKGQRLSFIKKCLSRDNCTVVEIGCGSGHNLFDIREYFNTIGKHIAVFGCDYSEECIESAKADYGIKVFKGDAKAIADYGIKADLVVLSHVLEHFTDLKKELEIIGKLLKEDGTIYIEVPGILDIRNKVEYKSDFINYLTLAHNYCFCLGTLENVMGLCGFELLYGNEYVCAVFKKSTEILNKISIKNYSGQVYSYLIDLEKNKHIYNNLFIYKMLFTTSAMITFGGLYAVYGTGGYSEYITKLIQSLGADVLFYSDSDNKKWGGTFKGKKIIPPHELSKLSDQFHKVIIASIFADEIKNTLENLGFDTDKDVLAPELNRVIKLFEYKGYNNFYQDKIYDSNQEA